jgi:hypothetical protein
VDARGSQNAVGNAPGAATGAGQDTLRSRYGINTRPVDTRPLQNATGSDANIGNEVTQGSAAIGAGNTINQGNVTGDSSESVSGTTQNQDSQRRIGQRGSEDQRRIGQRRMKDQSNDNSSNILTNSDSGTLNRTRDNSSRGNGINQQPK